MPAALALLGDALADDLGRGGVAALAGGAEFLRIVGLEVEALASTRAVGEMTLA